MLIIGAALGGILLFLLATASANTSLFSRHYPLLLGLNAVLAAALLGLVGYQLVSLRRRLRQRVFGSRLTLRFLVLFATMAVLPGMLVYLVSVQFLSKSIESWFDVRVDSALEGGIKLGQAAVDQMLGELNVKAQAMALELADRPAGQQVNVLNRLREQAGVEEAVIVAANGRLVASANDSLTRLLPDLPSAAQLRQARASRSFSVIDTHPGKPLGLRVVVPVASLAISDEVRYLQLRQTVPEALARSAEAVEAVYRDYRELALSRQGLKRIYIVTLTLALLMALFSAVALAFILSDRLSTPLSDLAQATQAVARGDFSRRARVNSRDELGVLIESFNSMTTQLDEARSVVEANKTRLENILANLSAGVLVFDRDLRLTISNHGAASILGDDLPMLSGRPLEDWSTLEAFAAPVREAFASSGDHGWQREISLKGTGKTLLARGTSLPGETGYVLVFDDVTQLIQAQRATAWAEVARRLAHEIKNPLTPIQLSAERLEMKLSDKLSGEDAQMLSRGTRTIVDQVSALKSMVDDFRDYARLPAPAFSALDLNELVADVLLMYETSSVPVRRELADALPQVRADAGQLRQVLHNLVQNAQDALTVMRQERADAPPPQIEVRTELYAGRVRLAVSDNGSGFPEEMMARIFEPYVTTKPRGTGLGLAIVKKIVDEHRGEISVENRPAQGACVSILFPMSEGGAAAKAA